MNKQTMLFGLIILALVLIPRPQPGIAQTADPEKFMGTIPFGTAAGNFGMFNRATGTIYIYDNNLSECIFIGHLEELGQPIKKEEISK